MNQKPPTAVATVRFNEEGVTGEQLAALVQQLVGQNQQGTFIVVHQYYDGDVMCFGQTSGYPHNHIRVIPSLDGLPFFDPTETYSEAKITSHSWGGSVYAVGYSQQLVIDAVKKFADELDAAYNTALNDGFPEYVEPKNTHGDW